MKALFPISLSNQRFSTSLVIPAIEGLVEKYDEVLFLVADRLQVYNRAVSLGGRNLAEASGHKADFGVFRNATRLTGTFEERRRWLDKVKLRLGERAVGMKWSIESVDSIADSKSFEILRNIDILNSVDPLFRQDILSSAVDFASRHPESLREVAVRLSTRYIIEELALSIRVRVHRKYYDEYYIGSTLLPAIRLYSGAYMATPWDIAGVKRGAASFRFFELARTHSEHPEWISVGMDSTEAEPFVRGHF